VHELQEKAQLIARDLLKKLGSLNGIFSASLAEVNTVHGMGENKFCRI